MRFYKLGSYILISRLLGVDINALITDSCFTTLRWAVVLAPTKQTLRSAETLVSKASS